MLPCQHVKGQPVDGRHFSSLQYHRESSLCGGIHPLGIYHHSGIQCSLLKVIYNLLHDIPHVYLKNTVITFLKILDNALTNL